MSRQPGRSARGTGRPPEAPAQHTAPMRIVYNAFNGRYADSPAALHRGLLARHVDAEHVWLQDARFAAQFPAHARTVPIGTPDAVAALGSADLLVSNTHIQLNRWEKPAGARYLQTWHGTPLKRIHRAAASVPGEEVMGMLDADIARWDALVSQSPAASALLRDAFAYGGPVLETGYPRNDVLAAPDVAARRRALRERLGIAEDVTAVLYAPTYRDDTVDDPDAADGPDVEALARQLGPGFVVLLRHHYYLFRRPERRSPGVVDVSGHPDVAELYLAADVLVTDYSSAMFDFAVTGKPILLFTYDLADYRDRLRGFYLDLEQIAPGPLVATSDEVLAALGDLDEVVAAHADRYAKFRQTFDPYDDGHATERVLDLFFPTRATAPAASTTTHGGDHAR